METETNRYDCAIIGGGLAGLCLSIQLAEKGIRVVLFEKNKYPFHKVCGEYISMESWDFLNELGLPLHELQLPKINELGISSEKGFMLNASLKSGGFGISRYTLDNELHKIALVKGVTVLQNCKVHAVNTHAESISEINTSNGLYEATIMCGSYGKYLPSFILKNKGYTSSQKNSPNFIGVKYHIKTNELAHNRIELHNFKDGYCGISKVEKDWYCMCYLSNSKNLKENGNELKQMEEAVLYKNPRLKNYFVNSEFINAHPLVISNIQFSKKQTYSGGVFLLGDAAGSITPLCGNGMSMAMRASKLLAIEIMNHLNADSSMAQLISNYKRAWNHTFENRIKAGYYLQNLFGKKNTTHITLKLLAKAPLLTQKIISLTHGQPF